eukprot:jgi/Tetstr1/447171/TSEL_034608.t1
MSLTTPATVTATAPGDGYFRTAMKTATDPFRSLLKCARTHNDMSVFTIEEYFEAAATIPLDAIEKMTNINMPEILIPFTPEQYLKACKMQKKEHACADLFLTSQRLNIEFAPELYLQAVSTNGVPSVTLMLESNMFTADQYFDLALKSGFHAAGILRSATEKANVRFTAEQHFLAAMCFKDSAFTNIMEVGKDPLAVFPVVFTSAQYRIAAEAQNRPCASDMLVLATLKRGANFTAKDHFDAAMNHPDGAFNRLRHVTYKVGVRFTLHQYCLAAARDSVSGCARTTLAGALFGRP